ncbi:MAG: TolB protein [Candidatus Promineifilaceae bacterium]
MSFSNIPRMTCWLVACVCICLSFETFAQGADIRILKDGANKKITIDVSASGSSSKAAAVRAVLFEDLKRSGWFVSAPSASASFLVSLNVGGAGDQLSANVQVTRNGGAGTLLSKTFTASNGDVRWLAHEIADALVWKIKKRPGIATSRILMVGQRSGRKDLYFSDYDGHGLRQITHDGAPCHSPSWGATAFEVYYTSPYAGFPDIYRIDLKTRNRARVAKYPGLNAGAAMSPDGRSIAMILSRDGNPELYVQNIQSQRLQRMTTTRHAAEASPSWAPDGSAIVYVSDSTGAPQLYIVARNGGRARRLTTPARHGSENVSPDWGPDGTIVCSSRHNRRYQLMQIDPDGGNHTLLTSGHADHEEPSWARDGRHIVYVKTVGYKESLYILDTMGDPEIALTRFPGEWYSPAWSRFE